MNIKIKFTDEYEAIIEKVSYFRKSEEYLEVHYNDLSIEVFPLYDIKGVFIV